MIFHSSSPPALAPNQPHLRFPVCPNSLRYRSIAPVGLWHQWEAKTPCFSVRPQGIHATRPVWDCQAIYALAPPVSGMASPMTVPHFFWRPLRPCTGTSESQFAVAHLGALGEDGEVRRRWEKTERSESGGKKSRVLFWETTKNCRYMTCLFLYIFNHGIYRYVVEFWFCFVTAFFDQTISTRSGCGQQRFLGPKSKDTHYTNLISNRPGSIFPTRRMVH